MVNNGERSCKDCQYRAACNNWVRQGDWIAEVCSTYQRRIDRDALLELADELVSLPSGYASKLWYKNTARRIEPNGADRMLLLVMLVMTLL